MSWAALKPLGGIDWSDPDDCALFDPYLQWALATRFRGYATDKRRGQRVRLDQQRVPIALELLPGDAGRRKLRALEADGTLQLPSWYLGKARPQHCTARIRIGDFERLRGQVRRMELGVTALRVAAEPPAPPRALGEWVPQPAAVPRAEQPRLGRTVIGIIDDGCAFAHQQFRDARGGTRVRWLWQQDGACDAEDAAPRLWTAPAGFHYGAETTSVRLAALMQPGPSGTVDEAAAYQRAGLAGLALGQPPHGTRVMDFAAGGIDPMHRQVGDQGLLFPLPSGSGGASASDAAGQADIVFVQMPRRAMLDASGAWLTVHVLDAVHYVLSRAGDDARVVVNISLGAFAGPHDGSSLLESALDALIEQHAPRLSVVVAAGNSYRQAAHAELALPPGQTGRLRWDVPVDDRTETFVELWAAAAGPAGAAPALPQLQVQPDPPRGCADASPVIGTGASFAWFDAGGRPRQPACVVLNAAGRVTDNASRLVLVSIAPAQPLKGAAPSARSGSWSLAVTNTGDTAVQVHAYVERDDPPFGGAARQTVLVGETEQESAPVSPRGTLSSLATGRQTIVVGAHQLRDGDYASFTASGPARDAAAPGRPGPDLTAPGTGSASSRLLAAGARSGGAWVRCEGTSMAAPVVTRQIVNLVATDAGRWLDREQILQALVSTSPVAPWPQDPARGGRGRLKHWLAAPPPQPLALPCSAPLLAPSSGPPARPPSARRPRGAVAPVAGPPLPPQRAPAQV
jgi:hypothetical protein